MTDSNEAAFAAGMKIRREMFGPGGAEERYAQATDFNRPLEEIVTRYCFGETWTRPGLDRKTRSLVTLATLTALSKPNQIKVHVAGALANGCTSRGDPRNPAAHHGLCGHSLRRGGLQRRCRGARAPCGGKRGKAMNVAVVGVGNMGAPMAACMARAGHSVTVYDSSHERAIKVAAEHGCRAAANLDDLSAAQFVVTMLPTGQVVSDLYLRDGLAQRLARGTIAIDMSSSDPSGTRRLGATLAERGIVLIDAPVSGGVPRAALGTLAIMIGGDDRDAIERARALLRSMGDRLFDTGGLGTGHAMKALNNFVAAAGYAACAEALIAGERFGLDPTRMVEILNVSTGRNFHTDVVLREQVIGGKFATGFSLGLLAKDVKIAADLTRDVKVDAPLVRLVSARFDQARDALGYASDNSRRSRPGKDARSMPATDWNPCSSPEPRPLGGSPGGSEFHRVQCPYWVNRLRH